MHLVAVIRARQLNRGRRIGSSIRIRLRGRVGLKQRLASTGWVQGSRFCMGGRQDIAAVARTAILLITRLRIRGSGDAVTMGRR